jgi:hypothetical protein
MEEEDMAEQDPRTYRGGVHEAEDAKGGVADDGVVPRDMVDDPGAPPPERQGDDQALSDASLGQVTDRSDPSEDSIDPSGGDEADATSHSGTGANAAEIKEEMQEGEGVPWVQAANVARENTNEDETAEAS